MARRTDLLKHMAALGKPAVAHGNVFVNPHECLDDRGIVHPAASLAENAERSFVGHGRRYGRSEVKASKQSTTDRILAPIGISALACTRRTWLWVTSSFASIAIARVSIVDT